MVISPVPSGTYVIAVSGGVDSVVLLDVLMQRQDITLIVAHLDHGIRGDSADDARLVEELTKKYGCHFELRILALGPHASEELARNARYKFLQECRIKYNADAIITAHHQDDVLETIIINLIRGTGWRGLVSLRSHDGLLRPLLNSSKEDIVRYGYDNNLQWREDSTNMDTAYLRNYVRHTIMPSVRRNSPVREKLVELYNDQLQLRMDIEQERDLLMQRHCIEIENVYELPRHVIIMVPEPVALELLQSLIVRLSGRQLQQEQVRKLLWFVKSAKANKWHIPTKSVKCRVTESRLIVERGSIC